MTTVHLFFNTFCTYLQFDISKKVHISFGQFLEKISRKPFSQRQMFSYDQKRMVHNVYISKNITVLNVITFDIGINHKF